MHMNTFKEDELTNRLISQVGDVVKVSILPKGDCSTPRISDSVLSTLRESTHGIIEKISHSVEKSSTYLIKTTGIGINIKKVNKTKTRINSLYIF